MTQIGTQGDASSHQGQAEQCLQREPGEIEQRPHVGAVQFHKGILQGREEGRKREGIRDGQWTHSFHFHSRIIYRDPTYVPGTLEKQQ